MKQHTVAGCEIIDRIIGNVEHEEYVDIARKIARYHHERWDGTGYPGWIIRGGDSVMCKDHGTC